MNKYVKIIVFVPEKYADEIRLVLGKEGAGKIGNYDFTSFSTKGIGRFRPLTGSDPVIGSIGKIEEVLEERIETICNKKDLDRIVQTIKKIHPYEEPVIDVFELTSY